MAVSSLKSTSLLLSQSGHVLSLQDAKTHLRVNNRDLDEDVKQQLIAAVNYCENVTGRSFAASATYRDGYPLWQSSYRFNYQPVTSIGTVEYYDGDGAIQLLDSSLYTLHESTDNQSWLEMLDTDSLPALPIRGDAVRLTYDVGQETQRAKQAVKMQLSLTWGDLTPNEATAYQRALENLLASLSYGYR